MTQQLNAARSFTAQLDKQIPLCPALKSAFEAIPRELFVPAGLRRMAYQLEALPMGADQWLSSPLTVAKMTQALEYKGADSVLEIGCGSGYQAAILSKLFRRVFTIERIERLLNEAKGRFKELSLINVHTRLDDGQKGWAQYGPYDRILFSASTAQVPQTLFDQLTIGGILVAPIENGGKQVITRYTKGATGLKAEVLESCRFVPVLDGVQRG